MTWTRGVVGAHLGAALTFGLLAIDASAQVPRRPPEEQPPTRHIEEHHREPTAMSPGVRLVPLDPKAFGKDPVYEERAYDAAAQLDIYGGKRRVEKVRPLIELGGPLYGEGPLGPSYNLFGAKNLVAPQLYVYGDWRTTAAANDNGAKELAQIATRLNLDVDLKLTATERLHALVRPLDRNGAFTRYEFGGQERDRRRSANPQTDLNVDTLFFEGDAGQIASGLMDKHMSWDLPFTFGLIPLVFQNGIWLDDAFVGGAFAIPARNSRTLDISNVDFSFFFGDDKVTTASIKDRNDKLDENGARIFGAATFVETLSGYLEAGYGFTQDTRENLDFDYHNATLAFTRRYGGLISNSTRIVYNWGQNPERNLRQTADGFAILFENSLVTNLPSTLVPYANAFFGKDRPQSLARDAGAGGILKNTGLTFETDGLTGFPKLDDTANDTFGGAVGVQYLFSLNQQVVVEAATVQTIGGPNKPGRAARGDQHAFGVRYQLPITNAWIFRSDGIWGWLDGADDVRGIRFELRRKF